MKQPGILLKVITVTGFVLLLSVFVAYRAGSFSGLAAATNSSAFPAGDSPVTFADTSKIEIMPGSKSGPVMSSSKSSILFEPDTGKPKQKQQQPERDPMMGSSKSGVIFTSEPDTSKPQ